MSDVAIITAEPVVEVLAEMKLNHSGVMKMAEWVAQFRPNCVPSDGFSTPIDLVPHDGLEIISTENPSLGLRVVTDNELLCELAGRKCYDSFADAGARRSNREYLDSMWKGRVPHRSTAYHAKMTFFFANISRRVSHELIRNYVGSDRTEEGSPSQESTRFTHHYGAYVAPPYVLDKPEQLASFAVQAELNYADYKSFIYNEIGRFQTAHGQPPKGLDRKRIYEAASGLLLQSCATSFIWTTNPMALVKFFQERDDEAADLEMQRFARKLRQVAEARWPNLFHFAK